MLTGLNCGSIWPDEMRWWGRLDEVASSDSFHVIAPISAIWQWAIQAANPGFQPLALPLVLGAFLLDRLRPYTAESKETVSVAVAVKALTSTMFSAAVPRQKSCRRATVIGCR